MISVKPYDTVRCNEPNQQITLTDVMSPSTLPAELTYEIIVFLLQERQKERS